MKKNEIYEVDVVDNGIELEGICKINDMPIFVPGLIKDEKAKIKILKVNKSFAYGKIEEIQKESKYRIRPMCENYKKCGGCSGLHIDYTQLLDIKRKNAINTLNKQGLALDESCISIYGMGNPYNYRNKVQFPIRSLNGKIALGMFPQRSHELVQVKECLIQDKHINDIATAVIEILEREKFLGYNEQNCTGDIKNIVVRKGIHTNEVMVTFVLANKKIASSSKWNKVVTEVIKQFKDVISVNLNINEENTNVILSNENMCIYGQDFITDYIGDFVFKIGVNSFFQVNTLQAEVLYNVLKDNLKLVGSERLLDLYSGVGSIGIFLSKNVDNVYGIEIVDNAVKMAQDNIQLNELKNVKCIQGDATIGLEKLRKDNIVFDVVVVDPPRKGLDNDGIELLKQIRPQKIGYVSCNVATLARDLAGLRELYDIGSVNFVDMFPFTPHVECVVVLRLKETLEIQ